MHDHSNEYRCAQCNSLLFRAENLRGHIAVKCLKCKRIATFTAGPDIQEATVSLVRISELLETMERRWQVFAARNAAERARISVGIRFRVFDRDGFCCRYCGISVAEGAILHADHVVPQSKGGPTTFDNLVTACADCNLGKTDRALLSEVPAPRFVCAST
jgi:phage FluMu protein Com